MPLQLSHLIETTFGNVDVAVAHLHVDPQARHHRQTVLVVPQVLWENSSEMLNHVCRVFKNSKLFFFFTFAHWGHRAQRRASATISLILRDGRTIQKLRSFSLLCQSSGQMEKNHVTEDVWSVKHLCCSFSFLAELCERNMSGISGKYGDEHYKDMVVGMRAFPPDTKK